jgi:GxxExxY protein
MNSNRPSAEQSPSLTNIIEKELSYIIVGAFFRVYNALGFGFLESIYARALEIVLKSLGLRVEREYPIAVHFEAQQIGFHRVDMLVERRIIVEIKSTERLAEGAKRQLRSYVTAANLELGLLLHFGPKPNSYRILGRQRVSSANPICPNSTNSDQAVSAPAQ